ncbi:hypothetical protein BGX26_002913 [Mortierella sp. AD094]|nr:hypothetical protein BGX26_002913 [Mortierella sp. AD094]
MTDWSKKKRATQPPSWKAAINKDRPGANYFLSTEPGRFDPLDYFKSRGATSDKREALSYEWASWLNQFSTSDVKCLRDISVHLKSYKKLTLTRFWEDLTRKENNRRWKQRHMDKRNWLMNKRKLDLRKQNIDQFRSDGAAMTRELDQELNGSESLMNNALPSRRESLECNTSLSGRESPADNTSPLQRGGLTDNTSPLRRERLVDTMSLSGTDSQDEDLIGDIDTEGPIGDIDTENLAIDSNTKFSDWIRYIFNESRNIHPNPLPKLPDTFGSKNEENILRFAHQKLSQEYITIVEQKHVLVALSNIINTDMKDSATVFGNIVEQIQEKCQIPIRKVQEGILKLLSTLVEKEGIESLLLDVQIRKGQLALQDRNEGIPRSQKEEHQELISVLSIVEYLATMIKKRKFENDMAELGSTAHWNYILSLLIEDPVYMDLGELACKASQRDIILNERLFGKVSQRQTSGRKIDMMIRALEKSAGSKTLIELGCNEHKASHVSNETVILQALKSHRINASILTSLEDQGYETDTTFPAYLDIHGTDDWCNLCPKENRRCDRCRPRWRPFNASHESTRNGSILARSDNIIFIFLQRMDYKGGAQYSSCPGQGACSEEDSKDAIPSTSWIKVTKHILSKEGAEHGVVTASSEALFKVVKPSYQLPQIRNIGTKNQKINSKYSVR